MVADFLKKYNISLNKEHGLGFYANQNSIPLKKTKEGYVGKWNNVEFHLGLEMNPQIHGGCLITASVENFGPENIEVGKLGLSLGIDTYMDSYPEWNQKFFPTMLRCEKTHLWGYFMSPLREILAIAIPEPVASWHLDYNISGGDASHRTYGQELGHRIYTACIDFFCSGKLPNRHPNQTFLETGKKYTFHIHLFPLNQMNEEGLKIISDILDAPIVVSSKYTFLKGEKISYHVISKENVQIELVGPNGNKIEKDFSLEECGSYILKTVSENKKCCETYFYCRESWEFYLKAARKECINKQQKASTHCESWYGFFSGFLAAKHYPDKELDKLVNTQFDEVLPLIFDLETGMPKTHKIRIQNSAAMVSLLADKYLACPEKNKGYLELGSKIGDYLMSCQTADGVFRRTSLHYTCVIYIAKSMIELAIAEKSANDEYLKAQGEKHFLAAGRAIEDLVEELDQIGTEGEHTLEDGMVSCSALQIAMYALLLPKEKRERYIKAAEHMIQIHECLEQNIIPDARMNGGSLRFWEAQYDILYKANFMNSPHGWTAWTIYAKYYLYLLTGKTHYLQEMINAMSASAQLMDLNGNLRWAFEVDPQVCGKRLVPDENKPIVDGYQAVAFSQPAYRGKYVDYVAGEEYLDLISGWYRMGEQKVNGGFDTCPLITGEMEYIAVDNQGGCCDNDVHEIFKALEEVVLKKAYIAELANGEMLTSGCIFQNGTIALLEDCEQIHINFKKKQVLKIKKLNKEEQYISYAGDPGWYQL